MKKDKKKNSNDNEEHDVAQLSNSFSTGGGGMIFEHRVQASLVLTMLVGEKTPLIEKHINEIHFQPKNEGWDVDDLMVVCGEGDIKSKLLFQIKHDFKITESNKMFSDIIVAAWSDFNKESFNRKSDRIVVVSGAISYADILRQIHDDARMRINENDFITKSVTPKFRSDTYRNKLNVIRSCLNKAAKRKVSDQELWEFCKVFAILVFDLDYKSSVNEWLLRSLANSNTKANSDFVWEKIVYFAAECDRGAAVINIDNIPENIYSLFSSNQAKTLMVSENGNEAKRSDHVETNRVFDIEVDPFWAKLAIIGAWSEKSTSDIAILETVLGTNYTNIEKKVRESYLNKEELLSYSNGTWFIEHRRNIIESNAKCYFDSDADILFDCAEPIYKEIDARMQNNGKINALVPSNTPFSQSGVLREHFLHGLALLSNIPEEKTNCSSGKINLKSLLFVRGVLKKADNKLIASMDRNLVIFAEINPDEYLDCLESITVESPEMITPLFPLEKDNLLFSNDAICSVLWSLEALAWDNRYFIKAIRILALLENIEHPKSNLSNTPLNSIISIMLPWHIQTLATVSMQKSAIKAILRDSQEIAWKVIKKLLPHATPSTSGTNKPKYIMTDIPSKIFDQDQAQEMYKYYLSLAVEMATDNYDVLNDLMDDVRGMDKTTVISFLNILDKKSEEWGDELKYPIWGKLSDQLYLLKHDVDVSEYPEILILVDNILIKLTPSDIRFKNRLIYEQRFFDFDDNYGSKWQERRKRQRDGVIEIYKEYGLQDVIVFGEAIKNKAVVARNLGSALSSDEIRNSLELCYSEQIDKDFVAHLVYGYINQNGTESFYKLELERFSPDFISMVLSWVDVKNDVFDIVHRLLAENDCLYWQRINVDNVFFYDDVDMNFLWSKMIEYKRYVSAINMLELFDQLFDIERKEVYETLYTVGTVGAEDIQSLKPNAVCHIIEILQKEKSISIEELSNIEWIYLPWLDKYSGHKPIAIKYRLSNEPQYFCALVERMYKRRCAEKHDFEINQEVAKRLFEIFYAYDVVPGTSWEGEYNRDTFSEWIKYCKSWGEECDRKEIVFETIGNGLSYAKKDNDGLVPDFVMDELDKAENEDMRRGYYIGVQNQRGVHLIDPEGKSEYALAEKYLASALKAEEKGYTRYADVLKQLSSSYIKEAGQNKLNHQLEQEHARRLEE